MNAGRNPYISADGQCEVRKSIVAFVDILGFEDRVRYAKEQKKSQAVFAHFNEILSTWYRGNEGFRQQTYEMPFIGGKGDKHSVRVFSDSILIACPIKNDGRSPNFIEGSDEFYFIFSELQLLQLQMVNEGYYLRGAITVDELFMDDVIIYGMGLIDSHAAENSQAKYPRIILTKTASSLLEKIDKSLDESYHDNEIMRDLFRHNYLERDARKDDDELYFLNYLEVINIGDYPFLDELEKHKQMVEDRLNEYADNSHILEKYQWVAKYHNCFCNQHGHSEYMIEV